MRACDKYMMEAEIGDAARSGKKLTESDRERIRAKWQHKSDAAVAQAVLFPARKSYHDMTPTEQAAEDQRVIESNQKYFRAHPDRELTGQEKLEGRWQGEEGE